MALQGYFHTFRRLEEMYNSSCNCKYFSAIEGDFRRFGGLRMPPCQEKPHEEKTSTLRTPYAYLAFCVNLETDNTTTGTLLVACIWCLLQWSTAG